jgi:hypothetical protein
MWKHWVIRANTPFQPFSDFETARKTWASLNKIFPQITAAVLMPNHGHFILPTKNKKTEKEEEIFYKFCGILSRISREKKTRNYWQPIPPPALIPDKHHLKRQVRYVALNPCRKKLCRDPLEWYWSSYRELFGASASRLVTQSKLANTFEETRVNFLDRFHAYVSGDPSVAIEGTPPPILENPQIYACKSIDEILAASAAALRVHPSTVRKKGPLRALFIHLAHQHGWGLQTTLLVEICEISPRAIQLTLKQPIPTGINAAHLCLSDSRLRPNRVTQDFIQLKH